MRTHRFEMKEITGVIAAMITCFDEHENVDVRRTENLVDFLFNQGIDDFYLTGSTGEGFLMTNEERKLVVETVVNRVAGRKPVIVHVGDIGTRKSIDLARHACQAGADAISSVPPFYWKFNQEDIYNYYKDISQSTPLPLIIYNVPLAGMMGYDTIMKLSELPNVKGMKYTGKDHDMMGHLKYMLGDDFMIYSGCDEMAFSGLSVGADGIIGSFYNVMPDLYKKIVACAKEGNMKEGTRLQRIAAELILPCIKYDYIPLMRNMLAWQNVDAGWSRRPFRNYKEEELEDLKAELRSVKEHLHITDEVSFMKYL